MDSNIVAALVGGAFGIAGVLIQHWLTTRSGRSIVNRPDFDEPSRGHSDIWHTEGRSDLDSSSDDFLVRADRNRERVDRESAEFWAYADRHEAGALYVMSGFVLLGFDLLILIFAKDEIVELLPSSWGENALALVCLGLIPVFGVYWIARGFSILRRYRRPFPR
ncbi:MAG: hypothetical protein ACYS6K_18280 [Planctomycetota bacterium]|jgi:hypothetical protein